MNSIILLFLLIPLIFIILGVLFLIVFLIIRLAQNKNKGSIDYGNYSINILENNTTTEKDI